MARQLLIRSSNQENNILSATDRSQQQKRHQQTDQRKLDQMLRKTRSKEYMAAIHRLDAGGRVHNQDQVNEIINTIKKEFPEIELKGILLGYVAICYLGKPYEVHTLDMEGGIIKHYPSGQSLPGGMEKARGIAMYGGYDFIEVYVDCCRAVSANGMVSVIPY